MATTNARKKRKKATKSAQSTTTQASLERELEELRARVRELEGELEASPRSSRQRHGATGEPADMIVNMPRRVANEANKTAKAFALALLEPLRQAGDIIEAFASEVSTSTEGRGDRAVDRSDDETEPNRVVHRKKAGTTRRANELTEERETRDQSLSGSVHSGFVRALDRSLQVPSAMVDRLHQTYYRESDRARRR